MGAPAAWGPWGAQGHGPQGPGAQGHRPQGPMGLKDLGLKDPGPHGGAQGKVLIAFYRF